MARNSEKAMTALARWRQAKLAEESGGVAPRDARRPYLSSQCSDVRECEKWRLQIIREISRKVTQIQNAGLGEFKIRDLNDEINKLLREKRHWENRIIELGGRDMRRRSRMLDKEGKEIPGSFGYKYFGAARELPGVKELFDTAEATSTKKTRAELMKDIDAHYYGFRDDDDGALVPLELEAEKAAVAAALKDWKAKRAKEAAEEGQKADPDEDDEDEDVDIYKVPESTAQDEVEEAMRAGKEARFVSHVPIPSQKDISEALLRRKKQELLKEYSLDDSDDEDKKMNAN